MLDIWKTAVKELDAGRDFALATIIAISGACPRQVGARLLVLHDGTMVGTIGGGLFEAQVGDLAIRAIETKMSHRGLFSFCGTEENSAQMMCGGEADVLVEFVDHEDPLHQKILRRLFEIARDKSSAYLISEVEIPLGGSSLYSINHALMDRGSFRIGGFPGCLQLIESLRGREILKSAQLIELPGWEHPVFLEWIKPFGGKGLGGT